MAGMRNVLIVSATALALAACNRPAEEKTAATGEAAAPAATAATGPVAPPARKAGLWRQTISTGDFSQATRICLDETADREISLWGQQASDEMCQQNQVTRTADGGYRFNSVCDMGAGGKTTTSGVARGDFSANYVVEAESTTEGASAPQMNGTRAMKVEAVWEGPCPAGFKPGDMELPGGMRMNLADMAAAAKGAQ